MNQLLPSAMDKSRTIVKSNQSETFDNEIVIILQETNNCLPWRMCVSDGHMMVQKAYGHCLFHLFFEQWSSSRLIGQIV